MPQEINSGNSEIWAANWRKCASVKFETCECGLLPLLSKCGCRFTNCPHCFFHMIMKITSMVYGVAGSLKFIALATERDAG